MRYESGAREKLSTSPILEVNTGGVKAEAQNLADISPTKESGYWLRLASMLAVGSIPFGVLLFTRENSLKHYASSDALAIFDGFWAIFALWIMLDKGMDSVVSKGVVDVVWSLLGLSNVLGVALLFFFLE